MRYAIAAVFALALALVLGVAARDAGRASARATFPHDEARRRPARPAVRPRAAEPAAGDAPRPQLPWSRSSRALVVPILTYHRIAQQDGSLPAITRRLTVSPAEFARQLAWLADNGFHPIRQRQLWEGSCAAGRCRPGRS